MKPIFKIEKVIRQPQFEVIEEEDELEVTVDQKESDYHSSNLIF